MAATGTMLTAEEIGRRGQAIYEDRIRAQVEPERIGEFVAVDVFTGDYSVDPDEHIAVERLDVSHPDGLYYVARIGYEAAHFIGGGWQDPR